MRLLELAASRWTAVFAFAAWMLAWMLAGFLVPPNAPIPSSPAAVAAQFRIVDRILALGLGLSLAGWVGARLAYPSLLLRRLSDLEIRDAGPRDVPIGLLPIEGQIEELGFRPVGQVEARLPWHAWKRSWVYAAPEPISAALDLSRRVDLTTTWPDGSYVLTVITSDRLAQRLTANAWQLVSRGDLATALARHREAAAQFGAGRGAPLPVRTTADAVDANRLMLPHLAALLAAAGRRPRNLAPMAIVAFVAVLFVISALTS